MCYIFGKLDHFVNDYHSNNIVKWVWIITTLRYDPKTWENIEKKMMAIDKHISKPNSNEKYFCMGT